MKRALKIFRAAARASSPEELDTWRAVLMREPCVYCGDDVDGLDHIVPRSDGGVNGWINRAPACSRCDNLKASMPAAVFLVLLNQARLRVERRAHRYRVPGARENAAKGMLVNELRVYRRRGLQSDGW